MAERRLLSKYAPPCGLDFWRKIAQRRQPDNQRIRVRMELPVSLRCHTCGNYIYKGTKLNSRKERCTGEMCLEIQVFRFYFRCTRCSAQITLKTDPQNSDYKVESGATHKVEPRCQEDEINGSSELFLNPTDLLLTKTHGLKSADEDGNEHSTLSPTMNPSKKHKIEPTSAFDDCDEPVARKTVLQRLSDDEDSPA